MAALRPDRRLSVELTNYGGEGGPRELRVDLIDAELTTVASLTPDAALELVAQTLDAVIAARQRSRPRAVPEPGE